MKSVTEEDISICFMENTIHVIYCVERDLYALSVPYENDSCNKMVNDIRYRDRGFCHKVKVLVLFSSSFFSCSTSYVLSISHSLFTHYQLVKFLRKFQCPTQKKIGKYNFIDENLGNLEKLFQIFIMTARDKFLC